MQSVGVEILILMKEFQIEQVLLRIPELHRCKPLLHDECYILNSLLFDFCSLLTILPLILSILLCLGVTNCFALIDANVPISAPVAPFELTFFALGPHCASLHVSSLPWSETQIYDSVTSCQPLLYHIFHLSQQTIFRSY